MEISSEYAVQMRDITKLFGNFTALDKVDLNVKKGTIHSLLGENGAGKSTLMNILYGMYQAEYGDIYLSGEKINIKSPTVAIKHGIGMVHQHFMLVDNFTVLQNIILGSETTKFGPMLDMHKAKKSVEEIMNKYGLKVNLKAKVQDISVGMQQRVEILKALYRGVETLILDEPTAVLTPQEIKELTQVMRGLTKAGKTIIIITHKLKEILETADVCTIIRRGHYIDTVNVKNTNEDELARMMVGRSVKLVADKSEANFGEKVFEIKNLNVKDERDITRVKDLSLEIRKGEIYGIAGIDGNGQKELIEAITCLINSESGEILINDNEIQNTTPLNVINNKVATVHEDRQKRGLVMDFSVAENLILEKYREKPFNTNGIIDTRLVKKNAKKLISQYDIRPEKCHNTPIRALSGGNQQKAIIAREIANDPNLLIVVQPTRGVDVGAIEYIHKTIIQQRDQGKAILLISYELDEVMNLSDTIGVIYDGHIVKEFKQDQADENTIGLLMAGGKKPQ